MNDRILRPRSVAIVGASPTPGSLGASVLRNLQRFGYTGELYLVNPKRTEISGIPCLPSVDALPEDVDCAVLAIPRAGVCETLRACAKRRIGSAIVFSSGFAESGTEGLAEQREITRIARENDIAIQGPNCLGTVNYVDGIALTFVSTPAEKLPRGRQGVAIVSQSGAMAAVLIVSLSARKLGVSFSVSTGNEAASGVEDYVEYMLGDPHTKIVTMIVEQFRDPARFLALAERANRNGKKIVLLHPGRSSAARASAATHTGALAGDYEVIRTKVRHAGVVFVETLEDLVDVSELLMRFPSLPAGGAAVLTESGAFKAMALDFCERIGLDLPPFTAEVDTALRAVLPDFIPPANPMDLTAQALVDPDIYRRTLPLILGDRRCGSLVLAIILTDKTTSALKFPPILDALKLLQTDKPVIFAGMDEGACILPDWIDSLHELGVSFFPSPERALRALGVVTEWEWARRARGVAEITPLAPLKLTCGVIPEYRSKEILRSLGIAVPAGALARTLPEAIDIARDIGYPVALKAQSAALSHKSDAGGVALHLSNEAAVADTWARMPAVPLDGILVEKMAAPGIELIVGARNDPDWGPILLVGFGGVLAEALRDVRLLPPNVPVETIERELYKLHGAALLRGFRGKAPADVRAAAEIVAKLGSLMIAEPSILEIDINPVVVHSQGQGALALDALIVAK